MAQENSTDDIFAQIATQRLTQRSSELMKSKPVEVPQRVLPLDRCARAEAYRPRRKIITPAQLEAELRRCRRRYATFLRDLAPGTAAP